MWYSLSPLLSHKVSRGVLLFFDICGTVLCHMYRFYCCLWIDICQGVFLAFKTFPCGVLLSHMVSRGILLFFDICGTVLCHIYRFCCCPCCPTWSPGAFYCSLTSVGQFCVICIDFIVAYGLTSVREFF